MYQLKITTASSQVIQHADFDPGYLLDLAGDYSTCQDWVLLRNGVRVDGKRSNEPVLPVMLQRQAD